MTAIYSDPKGVMNTDDVSNPKLFVCSSIKTPEKIPTSKPAISGSFSKTLNKDQRTLQAKFGRLLWFPKVEGILQKLQAQ